MITLLDNFLTFVEKNYTYNAISEQWYERCENGKTIPHTNILMEYLSWKTKGN